MKTTVKISTNRSIVVSPSTDGEVIMKVVDSGVETVYQSLTPDQLGALIFGLEMAQEAAQIKRQKDEGYIAKYLAKSQQQAA